MSHIHMRAQREVKQLDPHHTASKWLGQNSYPHICVQPQHELCVGTKAPMNLVLCSAVLVASHSALTTTL